MVATSPALVRLAQAGDGAAVVEVAESTRAAGGWADVSPLRRVLDQVGGQIAIPDLAGATGRCFVAVADGQLVGMLYACTPVDAIRACPASQHAALVRALIEIEIVAVAEHAQRRGIGTALVRHAEEHVRELGTQLITAKITATDMPVLRWWRHRGYTLARDDEACFLDQRGRIGLDAGHDGQWRLAARAFDRTLTRRHTGLWLTPSLFAA